jgi:hypothetical protein
VNSRNDVNYWDKYKALNYHPVEFERPVMDIHFTQDQEKQTNQKNYHWVKWGCDQDCDRDCDLDHDRNYDQEDYDEDHDRDYDEDYDRDYDEDYDRDYDRDYDQEDYDESDWFSRLEWRDQCVLHIMERD